MGRREELIEEENSGSMATPFDAIPVLPNKTESEPRGWCAVTEEDAVEDCARETLT